MSGRPVIDSLRLQIGSLRCLSIDKRSFVANAPLENILTPQTISQAVAELNCQPEERIGLGEAIQRKGITTFATLIWMRREDAIVDFRRRECLDGTLLSEEAAVGIAPSFGVEFVREVLWQFRPHIFHLGDDLEIDERKILPFLRGVGNAEEGGFASVSKVEVHPLLQDFYPGSVRNLDPK